jgi:hypothetical protein
MKRTDALAAHDRWFRAEVEAGLREANNPTAVTIAHEQVMAEMKAAIDRVAAKKRHGR